MDGVDEVDLMDGVVGFDGGFWEDGAWGKRTEGTKGTEGPS